MGGNEGPLSPVGCSLSSLSPSYLLSFLISSHASSSVPCGGGRMKTTACTDAEFKTTYVLHREKTTPPTLNKTSHRPLSHQTLSCLLLLINHTVMWTLLLKMLKEDSLTSGEDHKLLDLHCSQQMNGSTKLSAFTQTQPGAFKKVGQ